VPCKENHKEEKGEKKIRKVRPQMYVRKSGLFESPKPVLSMRNKEAKRMIF
jgi:hypothetical protein